MPRAGLSTARVVDEAAVLADEVGLDKLTLAELAARLGVRLPSLYKHVAGLSTLHRELTVRAKREVADVLARSAVGKSRGDALAAVAHAYRRWAVSHPGLYAASVRTPAAGDIADNEASAAAVQVVYDVLTGYRLGADAMIDATRTLRCVLHGFVMLERESGFGLDRPVENSLDWFLAEFDVSLSSAQSSTSSARASTPRAG